jgi:drug/metabolite transporter (DMT)-like permease
MFITAMAMTVVSTVFYHLIQKMTPTNAHPLLSLAFSYSIALVVCLVLLPAFPLTAKLADSIRQLNWTTIALGFAIVGIELGFLLAYRAGWRISEMSLVSTLFVVLALVPIGLLFFKEKLSPVNLVGILICIVGLVMVNWKR